MVRFIGNSIINFLLFYEAMYPNIIMDKTNIPYINPIIPPITAILSGTERLLYLICFNVTFLVSIFYSSFFIYIME